jgi:hypothetical protein
MFRPISQAVFKQNIGELMKPISIGGVCLVSLFFSNALQAQDVWQKINVQPGQYSVKLGDKQRMITPSCAFGQPYSFYIKPGKVDRVVMYFNGGGACWDFGTCAIQPNQAPVYVPTADAANNPNEMQGLLNMEDPDNPYKNWTAVFLPYCTGDVFTGSKQSVYENPLDPSSPLAIQHRGFDNFAYVLNYLKQQRRNLFGWNKGDFQPAKILVAGSSAGSYGAALNYPWIKRVLGKEAKVSFVSDGGAGVITDGFISTALFGASSSWYIDQNLHPIFSRLTPVDAADFLPKVMGTLANRYEGEKFGQYTNAYDAVQTLFLNIMEVSDGTRPPQVLYDLSNLPVWSARMLQITGGLTQAFPRNYRRYVDPGCNHTVLRFEEFYTSSLTTRTGLNLSFLDWLTGMTGRDKDDWKNLSCTPGISCGEENLSPELIQQTIGTCLKRSFGP